MQIEATMRYHLSEWLKSKTQETIGVGEAAEKKETHALLVGTQTGTATVENSMEDPQKAKNRTILWSSNHTTGYLSKEYKNTNSKIHAPLSL